MRDSYSVLNKETKSHGGVNQGAKRMSHLLSECYVQASKSWWHIKKYIPIVLIHRVHECGSVSSSLVGKDIIPIILIYSSEVGFGGTCNIKQNIQLASSF